MGFSCGIADLPNVGKSTLLNTLARSGIAAKNLPFCTIRPNSGVVPIPDARLNALAEIVKPERVLPTTMEFVDITGLVAGASKGEGLGSKFLVNTREADAITHVVRCSEDDNVIHMSNSVDPKRDVEITDLELIFADLDSCKERLQKVAHNAKGGDEEAPTQKALLEKLIPHLTGGKPTRSLLKNLGGKEKRLIHSFRLLTSKPVMYIANVAEDGLENNPHLDMVRAIAEEEGAVVVPVCSKIETEIAELEDGEEKGVFLKSLGFERPDLNRVIHAGYGLLSLQTHFTTGVKEVRAWTVRVGAIAPRATDVIHADFEKGFTRAEVVACDNFIQFKGEQGTKKADRWRLEGKSYIVKDGNVMHFYFSV